MKVCKECGAAKAESEFPKRKRGADGLDAKCKVCHNARYKRRQAADPALFRAYGRRSYWKDPERGRAIAKRWYDKHGKKSAPDKVKVAARNKLNKEVLAGRAPKAKRRQQCGSEERIEAHHHDYSEPLIVVWLCSRCHGLEHRTPGTERR